jgi:hypothetical protein
MECKIIVFVQTITKPLPAVPVPRWLEWFTYLKIKIFVIYKLDDLVKEATMQKKVFLQTFLI